MASAVNNGAMLYKINNHHAVLSVCLTVPYYDKLWSM